ncbi:hypothetical protein LTR66_000888 [Elasticomyces elasticus]|nr:hypothetical protein LTR66_000888 [Elasticomyces elasticus]
MSKKSFKSQASSGRVASSGGVGVFGAFKGFSTRISQLSYVSEPPDFAGISDPHVIVAFKNLSKKDSTTKAKALEDLQAYVSSPGATVEDAFQQAWVRSYPRTSIDSSRRVRQLAHTLQGQIASTCGKHFAKHMPTVAGAWLAGQHDSDRAASRAAQDAFKQVFPTPEKLKNVSKVFQQPILEYCRDAILNETLQTLSDERTVSPDDAEATYARVIATSMAVVVALLTDLGDDEVIKQQKIYDQLLGDSKIWDFMHYKDVSVRRSTLRLLVVCLQKQRSIIEANMNVISTAIVFKAMSSDQTGSASELVNTLAVLTEQYPAVWTSHYTAKKSAVSRLRSLLKRGSQSGSAAYWATLAVLFDRLPNALLPKDLAECCDLLKSMHDGIQAESRSNQPAAWQAYFKLVTLAQRASLSEEDDQQLMSRMVTPLVQNYIQPGADALQWSVGGPDPAATVAKVLQIPRYPAILEAEWPKLAAMVVQDIKSSAPEQSKDFNKSQTTVGAEGSRLAQLVNGLLRSDLPALLERVVLQSMSDVIEESTSVLKTRNGKPYGAAIVIDAILLRCKDRLVPHEMIQQALSSFILEDLSSIYMSPSQAQLTSILYQTQDLPVFREAWNATMQAILNQPDSESKLDMLKAILAYPRVLPAIDLVRSCKELQAYFVRQARPGSVQTTSFDLLGHALRCNLLADTSRDAILEDLTTSLAVAGSSSSALDGLERVAKGGGSVLHDFMTSDRGSKLMPALMALEESADDEIAGKAADISAIVTSGGDAGPETIANIIQQSLYEASSTTPSVDSLIEMALKKPDMITRTLPDFRKWDEALEPFLGISPKSALAITNPLGGAVHLVDTVKSGDELAAALRIVPRDAQGYSPALRVANYAAKLLDSSSLDRLDGAAQAEVFRLLALTISLTNENTIIAGSNNIYAMYTPEAEADVLEFVSEAQSLITDCISRDPAWMEQVLESFLEKTKGPRTPEAFHYGRLYATIVAEQTERKGWTAQKTSAAEDKLKGLWHVGDITFGTIAYMSAIKQPLSASYTFSKICNDIAADIEEVKEINTILEELVIFNAIENVADRIPKRRLPLLVKRIIPWLTDDQVITAVKAEACKALMGLLPAAKAVYGDHWAEMLRFLPAFWSTTNDLESELPLLHASLGLYTTLRALNSEQEVNEDLLDAWKESGEAVFQGLVELLRHSRSTLDDYHQPHRIVNELLSRQILKIPNLRLDHANGLYTLLYAPSRPIQQTAFELLHKHVPAAQEQISLDAALEDKTAALPDELLSLILEAPTLSDLAGASFDRMMPLPLRGYLFSWLLLFDHFKNSSYKVKSDYVENIKNGGYLSGLLDFAFEFLGHSQGRPVDISKFGVASYVPDVEESAEKDTQWLLAHLYYLALTHLPSLTKSYFLALRSRQTSLALESWTEKHISPLIINASLSSVADWATKQSDAEPDERLTIKVGLRTKEVNVSYEVDEQTMAIVVRLPPSYPLAGAKVDGISRVAVDEKKWQSWLRNCQGVITFSNGNLIDGLSAWRKNVTGALKGQTDQPKRYKMVNLRTQKRLAASVAGCGKRKIWLDPNEVNEISNANSRQTIRKLVADGLIIRKPVTMHSRARAREMTAARRIGRHRGFGKRKGTADARMPSQVLWMRRLRVLRRLLVKYRDAQKIDKHLYHELYHLSKGNTFKHKRALVEHIHKAKAEKQRAQKLQDEMDAKRAKTKAARERRQERIASKRNATTGEEEEVKA